MRNLINFLIRFSPWFLFLFYVVISCTLLFHNNPYQQYIYLTSANKVSAVIYNGMSNVTSYFHLRDINDDLQMRNATLETELINLKGQVADYELLLNKDSIALPGNYQKFDFILANVINNSIHKPFNYITIDKGFADGIREDMGVVDQNGVVGAVSVVGEHYSRLISLLNPKLNISCSVKNTNFFGNLVWDGKSPYTAILQELPLHVKFKKGDTIVTNGHSSSYPKGVMVGTIASNKVVATGNSFSLNIILSTDFTQLSTVRIITSEIKNETDSVEKKDKEEAKNE